MKSTTKQPVLDGTNDLELDLERVDLEKRGNPLTLNPLLNTHDPLLNLSN